MRRRPFLLGLTASLMPALAASADADDDWQPVKVRRAAPALRLKDLGGKTLDLKSYAGRTVIVNFWATWCPPCVDEMPALSRLNAAVDPEKVVILTVNVEDDLRKVSQFLKRKRLALTVLDDNEDAAQKAWSVTQLPTSFIVDPDQKVRYVSDGEVDFLSKELQKIISRLNDKK